MHTLILYFSLCFSFFTSIIQPCFPKTNTKEYGIITRDQTEGGCILSLNIGRSRCLWERYWDWATTHGYFLWNTLSAAAISGLRGFLSQMSDPNSPCWSPLPMNVFDGFLSMCMCSWKIHKVPVCFLKVQQQLECQKRSGLIGLALSVNSRLAQRNLVQKCLFFNSLRHAQFFYKLRYIYPVL